MNIALPLVKDMSADYDQRGFYLFSNDVAIVILRGIWYYEKDLIRLILSIIICQRLLKMICILGSRLIIKEDAMVFFIELINLIVTVAAMFSMAALFFRGREELSVKMCIACQGMAAVWCSAQILIRLAETDAQFIASYVYGNIGICWIGVCWLWFSILYCKKKLTGKIVIITMILPTFYFLSILTDPIHHLYFTHISLARLKHGILFYASFLTIYVYVLVGAVLMFRHMDLRSNAEESELQKNKAKILIVLSVLIPTIVSIYNMFF